MSLFGDDPRWEIMEDKIADLQAQVNQISVKTNNETPLRDDAITALRDRIAGKTALDGPLGIYRIQLSNEAKDSYDFVAEKSNIHKFLAKACETSDAFLEGSAIKTLCNTTTVYANNNPVIGTGVYAEPFVEVGNFKWHDGFVLENETCKVKEYDDYYVSFRAKDISTVRKIYEFKPKE